MRCTMNESERMGEPTRKRDQPTHLEPRRAPYVATAGNTTISAGARVYLPNPADFEMLNVPGATHIEHWPFFWRPFAGADKPGHITCAKPVVTWAAWKKLAIAGGWESHAGQRGARSVHARACTSR